MGVPQHLGPFVAYRYLGEGVGGQVVEAVHRWLRHPAAVKVQWPKWVGDLEIQELFVQEAHVLRRLEGPGVPHSYDVGQLPDGRLYVANELVAGQTLQAMLTGGPFLPRDVAHVLTGALDVIMRAHGAGIVHRNLKPAHLVVAPDGLVTLIDWGVAWVAPGAPPLRPTRGHLIAGTPRYMAPEQTRGEVSPASDVYALGVVAYEALTGTPPFTAPEPLDAIEQQRRATAPPVSARMPGVPLLFDRLVDAMLEKEPANRPSPAEVRAVLERIERRSDLGIAIPMAA